MLSLFRNAKLGRVFTPLVPGPLDLPRARPKFARGVAALGMLLAVSCAQPTRLCTVQEVDGGEVNGCYDGEYCATSAGGPCRAVGCQGICRQGCVTDADCGDAYVCNQGWCE